MTKTLFLWAILLTQLLSAYQFNVTSSDMEALQSLYDATSGDNWFWRKSIYFNLTLGMPWNFTKTSEGEYLHDPCQEKWQGVCCATNKIELQQNWTAHCSQFINDSIVADLNIQIEPRAYNSSCIVGIALPAYGLQGSLPSQFFNLTSLRVLWVSYNPRLHGTLPSIVGMLDNLVALNLQNNKLDGTIPTTLVNLLSLTKLGLNNNRFVGNIPSVLGVLTNLAVLYLGHNMLCGTIPSSLGTLTLLSQLYLSSNCISGSIPSSLGQLILLSELYVNNNVLDGTIPTSLAGLTMLSELGLNNNNLQGTIPSILSDLSQLSVLGFDNNDLIGTIPTSIGLLSKLSVFYVNNNNFEGYLPSTLGYLTALVGLYANNNNFYGNIPSSLGLMTSLQVLNGVVNMFSGSLPAALSGLKQLTTLLLHSNSLSGQPQLSFSGMQKNLTTLDLSENTFSGPLLLLSTIFELSSIESVALVSNCFTGSIPSQVCLSDSLKVLALDGLTSGSQCRQYLLGSSEAYVVKSYIQGGIPSCIFTMSSLEVLQLSGNGLSGGLPNTEGFAISSGMRNLSLSHNRLGGPIPTLFQEHPFALLDLSFNKFSGTINDLGDFFLSMIRNTSAVVTDHDDLLKPYFAHKQLVLQVNRLSGFVPSSFASVDNINVVYGNLFTCNNENELPENDPGTRSVQCGSEELNVVFGIWVTLFIALLIGGVVNSQYFHNILMEMVDKNYDHNVVSKIYDTTIKTMIAWTALVVIYGLVCDLIFKFINNQQYSTHTFQYAYTPSLAFMTSDTPAVWTLISAMTWMSLVYVMISHQQSRHDKQQQLSWRVTAAFVAVTMVDLVVVVLANVGYISVILHAGAIESFLAQMALTFLKLTINGWILPSILDRLASRTNSQSIRTGLLLSNNLLIPMFTIVCTEPNCFSELLSHASTISSLFIYTQPCGFVRFSNGDCIGLPTEVQLSYQPPFIYTFQCSSNMLTTYLPVFVMMYTYIGLIQPLLIAGLTISNFLFKSVWSIKITETFGCDLMLPGELGKKSKLFDGSQISVMFACHAVTLLTFGTAYPLLSVLICTAVCGEAILWHILSKNYLQNCGDVIKREAMETKLQLSCLCLTAGDLTYECRWMVMTVMALFFSFFLMDMAGDKAGDDWSKILWAPVTMLLWPVMMWILEIALNIYYASSVNQPPNALRTHLLSDL